MIHPRRNGFSLIEVVITVAILSSVVGIAIPSFVRTMQEMEGDQFIQLLCADMYLAANEALSYRAQVRITFDSWNRIYIVQRMWETQKKKVKIPPGFSLLTNFSSSYIAFNELGHVLQAGTITIMYPNGKVKKITVYMASGRFAVSTG
jgi:prepilin-type N-terminal cleavage/methylation domain-containing protein